MQLQVNRAWRKAAPQVSVAEQVAQLRLIRSSRVGPVTYHRLIAEHGSASAALLALPQIAIAAGVLNYTVCPMEVVHAEMRAARKVGAQMLCHGDANYPAALLAMPDAPPVLWAMGDLSLLTRPMVALVGARNASSLGLRMARKLAQTLGEAGFVVVSGLARGIDAAAHEAALPSGTVAVVAGGVDVIYPPENADLTARIAQTGCILSDQPMGRVPQARHFPARNRIAAGLSRAVVVVEAAVRSGSLITAHEALDLGREVLAVPGHPFDARAAGCNILIRDGATLIRSAQDVIEALGGQMADVVPAAHLALPEAPVPVAATPVQIPAAAPPRRPLAEMARLHKMILDRLAPSPLAEDQLIRDIAALPSEVTAELLSMELDGKIARQAGGLLVRLD